MTATIKLKPYAPSGHHHTAVRRAALIKRMERKARRECRTVSILSPHYASARTACEGMMIADLVARIDVGRLRDDSRDQALAERRGLSGKAATPPFSTASQ